MAPRLDDGNLTRARDGARGRGAEVMRAMHGTAAAECLHLMSTSTTFTAPDTRCVGERIQDGAAGTG